LTLLPFLVFCRRFSLWCRNSSCPGGSLPPKSMLLSFSRCLIPWVAFSFFLSNMSSFPCFNHKGAKSCRGRTAFAVDLFSWPDVDFSQLPSWCVAVRGLFPMLPTFPPFASGIPHGGKAPQLLECAVRRLLSLGVSASLLLARVPLFSRV